MRSIARCLRRERAALSLDANSGSPYTITTGFDDNGDSIFNDRPLLTPRNSLRLPWRSTLSANVSYTIPIGVQSGRGGRSKGITIGVSINNFTNRANYTGFSGVMTSEYFQQATAVANPRQVDFSVRFGF